MLITTYKQSMVDVVERLTAHLANFNAKKRIRLLNIQTGKFFTTEEMASTEFIEDFGILL